MQSMTITNNVFLRGIAGSPGSCYARGNSCKTMEQTRLNDRNREAAASISDPESFGRRYLLRVKLRTRLNCSKPDRNNSVWVHGRTYTVCRPGSIVRHGAFG